METFTLQAAFNIATGIIGLGFGWWLKMLHTAHRDLRDTDEKLAEKVQGIELLVAGQYVHQTAFKEMTNNIFSTLRRIEDKLDKKADRVHGQ
jgi:hypothetical protein